jgi:aminotransferase
MPDHPGPMASALSDRTSFLAPGLRRRMMTAATGMSDVIALGRGDPDFETPPHIVSGALSGIDGGLTHYTPWTGLPRLRQAIAAKVAARNGFVVDPDREVIVTGGAQEAVFLAMQLLLDPGDEVVVADPHYTAYDTSITLAGGSIVAVPSLDEPGHIPSTYAYRRALTDRSKVLLIINPGNPTGALHSTEQLRMLARLAIERDLTVVADEVYEDFLYGAAPPVSIASLPGMGERTISIYSLSKTYAMTGWRVGYLTAPKAFVERAAELHYAVSICASSVSQAAAIAALEGTTDHMEDWLEILGDRCEALVSGLNSVGIRCEPPAGGFTVLADIRATGLEAETFCRRLLERARVQIFPGTMYGPTGEGFVRISFLASRETIEGAVERVRAVIDTIADEEAPALALPVA